MKKPVTIALLNVALITVLIAPVYASLSFEASISRDFHVTFEFTKIPTATYDILKDNAVMNETTIPETIYINLADQGLVRVQFLEPSISKNDTTKSIVSTFTLRGLDVISSTINRATSKETFSANTTWRKFNLNVTSGFVYNFTSILSASLSDWGKTTLLDGGTSFSYTDASTDVVCSFSVSKDASNVYAVDEVIIFDLPYEPPWEDKLINSPVLILIALAIVGGIVFIYRKMR